MKGGRQKEKGEGGKRGTEERGTEGGEGGKYGIKEGGRSKVDLRHASCNVVNSYSTKRNICFSYELRPRHNDMQHLSGQGPPPGDGSGG